MNKSIADFVNDSPPSDSIGSLSPYLKEIELPAPIDVYIIQSRKLLTYGTQDRLNENPRLGGLLLLGAISSAEAYFRSVLSSCLDICPICRNTAAEKQINLGGVLWHGQDGFRRSAFEHMAFSSREELKKASSGYLGFTLKDSQFDGPLNEYAKACHLRHGIVHNGGVLPGRNAVQLGIKKFNKPVEIVVNFSLLQKTIAAIDSLVLTFNRELFSEMCKRWALDWRKREDWDFQMECDYFNRIWTVFYCAELNKNRPESVEFLQSNCMKRIRDEFNL